MAPLEGLSSREKEVVNQLLEGKSNKLIASSLSISERTVEFHLKNIYAKYQVTSRTELVLKLGESTVVNQGEDADNRDRRNSGNWAASLKEAVSNIGKELKMNTVMNSNVRSEGTPMTFFESIRTCLVNYAEFNGRASRPEFWWFMLFAVLVASALTYISQTAASVFGVAVLLPLLAAGSRRLHDIGKSGWWELFLLAPIGGLALVGILWALPKDRLITPDKKSS